jgi:hypothetical protein
LLSRAGSLPQDLDDPQILCPLKNYCGSEPAREEASPVNKRLQA